MIWFCVSCRPGLTFYPLLAQASNMTCKINLVSLSLFIWCLNIHRSERSSESDIWIKVPNDEVFFFFFAVFRIRPIKIILNIWIETIKIFYEPFCVLFLPFSILYSPCIWMEYFIFMRTNQLVWIFQFNSIETGFILDAGQTAQA